MNSSTDRPVLGVVGGLGPLASAEFLKTIYERSLAGREQEAPIVMLLSDPTHPDRTTEFLRQSHETLLRRLIESLCSLRELRASKVVICCITYHYLLPRVPRELREGVISLLDVIFDRIVNVRKKHLLFCTNGTRKMQLFETHERWSEAKEFFVLPNDEDQEAIHELIYGHIKSNRPVHTLRPAFEAMMAK